MKFEIDWMIYLLSSAPKSVLSGSYYKRLDKDFLV